MNELKDHLSKITDKYISTVKSKKSSKEGLDMLKQGFESSSELYQKLGDELIDSANNFLLDNNIENTDDAELIIKNEVERFIKASILN